MELLPVLRRGGGRSVTAPKPRNRAEHHADADVATVRTASETVREILAATDGREDAIVMSLKL